MATTGIIGLGLMGGSLGMALKQADPGSRVLGYARRDENRRQALDRGAADEVSGDPREVAADSDMIVLCLPVLTIPEMTRECVDALRDGAVVTDVGSTKEKIQQEMDALLDGRKAVFVGSHPICGSEQQGIDAARADLYRNAVTIVTGGEKVPDCPRERVVRLWESVGSRVVQMEAEKHDRCLARTSHLPHLTASLLAAVVGRGDGAEELAPFCGTGFRDATRLAEGAPLMWKDIVQTNQESIAREVAALREKTGMLLEMLNQGDLDGIERFLAQSRDLRRGLIDAGKR